jgi:hypothetical protein
MSQQNFKKQTIMQFDVVSSFFLIKWSKKEDKEKPK